MTTPAPTAPTASLSGEDAGRILRSLLLIRRTEEALIDLYQRNQVPGFIHPGIGEEAVHVGVCDHLDERDQIMATHRGHGEALAKGVDPGEMLAEALGKVTGTMRGKGGSLHAGDPRIGVLPASPLVAGGLGTMTGVALAHQLAGDDGVAVCFFGDGALNRGSFHEAVNLASLWQLPIVYACIDNGWAISVARHRSTAGTYVDRARGYGLPGEDVDGKDVEACHAAAGEAIARARAGGGPTMLFFDTPRGYGHEEGDAQPYRAKDEYQAAVGRDPVAAAIRRFTEGGLLDQTTVETLDAQVRAQVRAAVAFAQESPLPDPSEAFAHVLPSTGGAA